MLNIFRYRLEPPALEAGFRADALAADKRVAKGLAFVAVVFLIGTVPGTFTLAGNPDRLHLIWLIRAAVLLVAATAFVLVRRVDQPRSYDTIVSAWIGIWIVGIIVENALLPADVKDFVPWDVFLAVAAYAALPLSLPRQAMLALLLSAGDLVSLWQLKVPGPEYELFGFSLAYGCANVVGVFVSRERHVLRRAAFVSLKHEMTARTDAEAALSEVKTLQGIIPICAHCKNIRTDAGDWQKVEKYVRDHSEAQFSHGICPSCLQKHYPDVTKP